MRLRTPLTLAALLVLTCAAARAQDEPQQKDEQVIDDFVLSRGVSFEEPGKNRPQQGKGSRPAKGNRPSSGSGGVGSVKRPKKEEAPAPRPGAGDTEAKSGKGGASEAAGQASGGSGGQFVKAG